MPAPAQRRVSVGRLGTAPALLTAQTLAAAENYPGPGRGRLRIGGVGVFLSEGPGQGTLARYIWVWDVLSLSVASPALSDASESLGPGRAATGLVRVIRVTLSGSGLPRTFGPGRCTRVAGLGGESGGAGQSGGPNPGQSRVPCHRRIASASPARGYRPSLSARPGPRPVRCLHWLH